jgi:hypothetical protein
MRIKDLFTLHQGNSLELMHLETSENSNINFVSRTAQNNGVAAQVDKVSNMEPFPAGYITVALGGSILSSFVQLKPFYTAFHIMALEPKKEMTLQEKLYYCMCIKANVYRYGYGRQANKTLKDIELPDNLPKWVCNKSIKPIKTTINQKRLLPLNNNRWSEFRVVTLFDFVRGTRITKENRINGNIPLVTAGFQNQGIDGYIETDICELYSDKITIDMFGNAFYHSYSFYCDDNILVLTPKHNINVYKKLFFVVVLNADKYRYSYGRQYRQKDIKKHVIKLPVTANGEPDWDYMEKYIKALPYSDKI